MRLLTNLQKGEIHQIEGMAPLKIRMAPLRNLCIIWEMRALFRTNLRSFYLFNTTQFLGALNDNIFKLLVIYFLIHVEGPSSANTILSLAGAIFVIPFLLFSSAAGVLADRLSKRSIIVFAKMFELVVTLSACLAIFFEWEKGLFTALFLMGTHSALFGPSKYGIIPELVESKMVPKANGSITSMTYLAIILGTLIASLLTYLTNKNFILIALFCVLISITGLISSLGIHRTEAKRSTKKINPFFLYEIYQTLRLSWTIPHLIPCIFCSSFFLFIGAFTQLNMIPFAMQSLGLSEVGGGFLFLATAIGIAIGAVLSGRLAKERVELAISCIAGFFIALFFILLWAFSSSLIGTILLLTLLGIVGGAYLIQFDSYLQINSPDLKRGQIIAASSFFSFVGALLAAFYLYLVNEHFGFSASDSFAILGIAALIVNVITIGRLSALFLPYFAKKILSKLYHPELTSPIPSPSTVLFLHSRSWWHAILLFGMIPHLKLLVPAKPLRKFPWINGFFDSIHLAPRILNVYGMGKLSKELQEAKENRETVCIFFHREIGPSIIENYQNHLKILSVDTLHIEVEKQKGKGLSFRLSPQFSHKGNLWKDR